MSGSQRAASICADYGVSVPMRDGTALTADVFRPAEPGRYPVLLVRTPYDKLAFEDVAIGLGVRPLAAARAGYVMVVQDVRGTFASNGAFRPFLNEAVDGADTVAWAASQAWSNGAVGMIGESYLGATTLLAATAGPTALKAIASVFTSSEYHEGWVYQGGAFQLGFSLNWSAARGYADLIRRERLGEDVGEGREVVESILADPWAAYQRLPLAELPRSTPWLAEYGEWLAHPDRDEYWLRTAVNERYTAIGTPGFHVAAWHDIFLKGSLENYVGLRDRAATLDARRGQHLLVTPWGHGGKPNEVVGDLWFGATANPLSVDVAAAELEFFDAVMKSGSKADLPPVRIFVMGANRWRDEDEWPLHRAVPVRFFLRAEGKLTRQPPSDESADTFIYDPRDPVPTVGGNTHIPGGGMFMGPRDRRHVERRDDVLVYTTDTLPRDVEVTGPVTATLHVATSARDTDFTVALVDVHPDGRAIGICDGILRLRYRNGLDTQHLAEPGRPYEIEVDLAATSNVFKAGHRMRVEISSSNFPRFDRNPNHGGTIAETTASELAVAMQRVLHDGGHASFITLPIVGGWA